MSLTDDEPTAAAPPASLPRRGRYRWGVRGMFALMIGAALVCWVAVRLREETLIYDRFLAAAPAHGGSLYFASSPSRSLEELIQLWGRPALAVEVGRDAFLSLPWATAKFVHEVELDGVFPDGGVIDDEDARRIFQRGQFTPASLAIEGAQHAITPACFELLGDLPSLRELTYSTPSALFAAEHPIDGRLIALARCPILRTLRLHNVQCDEAGFAALTQLDSLSSLYLTGSNVDARWLGLLGSLPRLETLDLTSSQKLTTLVGLAPATRLRSLTLSGSPIDDDSASALRDLPALQRLTMWGTRLTEAGLATLLDNPTLTYVMVAGELRDAAPFERIKPSDRPLTLRVPAAAPACRAALSARLPNCSIVSPPP